LMNITTWDIESRVMLADRFLVRSFEQAIHLAVGVVEQLDLADAEFVCYPVARSLRYLIDGLLRKFQVIVIVHEPRHVGPLPNSSCPSTFNVSRMLQPCPPFGACCRVVRRIAQFHGATSGYRMDVRSMG